MRTHPDIGMVIARLAATCAFLAVYICPTSVIIIYFLCLIFLGNSMLEETIIAVVADHGGYRNTHGITPPMIAEVYVPLLLRGMVRDYILVYR